MILFATRTDMVPAAAGIMLIVWAVLIIFGFFLPFFMVHLSAGRVGKTGQDY